MSDYNGWTNWETWHVDLVADNEEPLHRSAITMAARCAKIRRDTPEKFNHARAVAAIKRVLAPAWRATRAHARANWPNDPLDVPNWIELADSYMDGEDDEAQYLANKAATATA